MERRAASRWMPLAVAVVSVVMGLGVALPAYAHMLGGPKAHVCHCDTGRGHAHCECPICFPDMEPSIDRLVFALESRCGDDDAGWRTYADPAVPPPRVTALLAPEAPTTEPLHPSELDARPRDPPDEPPPRHHADSMRTVHAIPTPIEATPAICAIDQGRRARTCAGGPKLQHAA